MQEVQALARGVIERMSETASAVMRGAEFATGGVVGIAAVLAAVGASVWASGALATGSAVWASVGVAGVASTIREVAKQAMREPEERELTAVVTFLIMKDVGGGIAVGASAVIAASALVGGPLSGVMTSAVAIGVVMSQLIGKSIGTVLDLTGVVISREGVAAVGAMAVACSAGVIASGAVSLTQIVGLSLGGAMAVCIPSVIFEALPRSLNFLERSVISNVGLGAVVGATMAATGVPLTGAEVVLPPLMVAGTPFMLLYCRGVCEGVFNRVADFVNFVVDRNLVQGIEL